MRLLSVSLGLMLTLPLSTLVRAQNTDALNGAMLSLTWRSIGPAIMGGRIDDIEADPTDSRIVYVATAAGGIFKTTNHGTTWTPLFQNEITGSIGDIAIAPSETKTLYVGTGEANNRQSSSWGNGVYKSTDAGTTWEYVGLKETHHIGRVIVHPTDPNTVWVAAGGKLWGPSPERGVFKTTDGGKTWDRTLFIDEDTGATDIVIDPTDPNTLYAATYKRRRTPFGLAGGGTTAGIHKSVDGGKTWKKLTEGLPTGELGRIGLAIFPKNPKVVVASIETTNGGSTQSAAGNGGVWKTSDGGEKWAQISDSNPRPMYFSQIRFDPTDENRLYQTGVSTTFSTDGGKTFSGSFGQSLVHADGHAFWIDPKDPNHLIYGCDGGIQWSWDRGRTWDYNNQLVVSQPYEVAFDYARPYNVYIGLQDNGSWGAPSQGLGGRGVTNDEWFNIGGGDGFHCAADPTDPNIVYSESQNGAIQRINISTGERKSIRPQAGPGEKPLRWDWNTPIVISPHNPKRLLVGSNRLAISEDRGDTWRLTGDLTDALDRDKLPIFGEPTTPKTLSRYDGEDGYSELTTVAESPAKAGILWTGADDGALSLSQDDGKTWTRLEKNVPGLPARAYVSRVVPSKFSPGRCYATFDNHRQGDFAPYVFVTEDFGKTWTRLASSLPEGEAVKVIREHPRTENLLLVGTERGLWISVDRGGKWRKFDEPLPTVPVTDIQIHPRDNALILATHGRGVWIFDDLGPLEAVARGTKAALTLAPPKPVVHYRQSNRKATTGSKIYVATNPAPGIGLSFWLPRDPGKDDILRLELLGKGGKVVTAFSPEEPHVGWNRLRWDGRLTLPGAAAPAAGGPGGGGGGGGFGFGARAPRVQPGEYSLRLTFGKETLAVPVSVVDDPRIALSTKDLQTLYATQQKAFGLYVDAVEVRDALEPVRTALADRGAEKGPDDVLKATAEYQKLVEATWAKLAPAARRQPGAGGGRPGGAGGVRPGGAAPTAPGTTAPTAPAEQGGEGTPRPVAPPPTPALTTRLGTALARLDSFTEAPSKATLQTLTESEKALREVKKEVRALLGKPLAALNAQRKAAGLKELPAGG